VPLFATLVLNFSLGALASLAAARELRASPRPVQQLQAFRSLALHEVLVALPIAAWLLIRLGDWMVSYTVDGARLPSLLIALLVLLHGALALGGFALGARLLRDHRGRAVSMLALGGGVAILLAAALLRERVGVLGTYVQFRGGFGLQRLWRTAAFPALLGMGVAWLLAAVHLLWSLTRRP
jgi:hypothetical protein